MIDRTLARLAAKARLPEWAAALSVIVLMDAVIAVAIVAAVRTNGAE